MQSVQKIPVLDINMNIKKVLDDKILSQNIEEVVRELKSDRFRKLVKQRKTQGLNGKVQGFGYKL